MDLPGDNFSLPELPNGLKMRPPQKWFWKTINSENNHVNNLDLNEDGRKRIM